MWLYLGLAIIALVFYWLKSFKYDHWKKKGVPTASGCEFFFGHLRPLFLGTKHMNEVYDALYKEFPDAPLVGYYVMSTPALLVRDVEIAKTILVTEFPSFNFNGLRIDKKVDVLVGSNPFFLTGEEWKTARSNLTPALTLAKLKGYLPSILDAGDEMVKYVKKIAGGSTVELEIREDLAIKFASDVIGNAIYGIKSNTFEDKDSLFAHLTGEISLMLNSADFLKVFLQQIPFVKNYFPVRFTSEKLQNLMVSLTRKIIAERKVSGEKRNDLYNVLMGLRENDTTGAFTDESISGQVFTVIIDLYETSSVMISLILYMISRHPDVQNKLRSEIREIVSKSNGEISIEDIENAKYLQKVYSETFRLNTFVFSRECNQDCYVPMPGSDPFRITKGTPIIIPTYSIHRDRKYYPDPDTFDPERFSEEEIAKRPKFSYMPFGEGPRKCMGIRLAALEIKVAIFKLVEKFSLKPSPKTKYPLELDPKGGVSLRAKDGAWVIFEEIK